MISRRQTIVTSLCILCLCIGTFTSGCALAKRCRQLDGLAEKLGVKPISHFGVVTGFGWFRIAVVRWSAFYDVGDINLLSLQANRCEHLVEQAA